MRWQHLARVQTEGDNHPMEDACGFAAGLAWMIDGATSVLEPLGLPAASDPAWLAAALNMELAAASCLTSSSPGDSLAGKSQPGGSRSGELQLGDSQGVSEGGVNRALSGSSNSGVPGAGKGADDHSIGVREALARALRRIDAAGLQLVGHESVRFPSAALSLAQLNPDGVEILSLADCHVVVREHGGAVRHVISSLADPGASWTLQELAASRRRRNTPEGLWVARREPEAADHALVVQCGFPETIVLASDGAWRAVDLGLVAGPAEFLDAVSDAVAAQQLMVELRRHQRDIGEKADDASLLVLRPESD